MESRTACESLDRYWHGRLGKENTDSGDSVSTAKRTQRVVSTLVQRKITPRTDQPILIVHIKN
jgi:hypothetical protein